MRQMKIFAIGSEEYEVVDELARKKVIFPEDFGAVGDGVTDDRESIQNAINFLSENGGTLKLKNKTYLLNSLNDDNIIYLKPNVSIRGKGTFKIGDNLGDYKAVFNTSSELKNIVLEDFTIDENTRNNPKTILTGSDKKERISIFSWQPNGLENVVINNITINDCIGMWQISMGWENAKNIKITNNTINYNETETNITYDRTSIYIACDNAFINNNTLNGTSNSRTGIESHGKDYIISNNKIYEYSSAIFIENDDELNIDSLGTIDVYDNIIKTSRGDGISLWNVNDNVDIDNILIHDNSIDVLAQPFYLYPGVENGEIGSVKFYNNYCKAIDVSKDYISLEQHIELLKTFIYHNFEIYNNYFSGSCLSLFKFSTTSSSRFQIKNLNIYNNMSDVDIKSHIISIVTRDYGFPFISIKNNTFNNIKNITSLISCYQINENPDNKGIELIDNVLNDLILPPYNLIVGGDYGIKLIQKFDELDVSLLWGDSVTNKFDDGSVLYDDCISMNKYKNSWLQTIKNTSIKRKFAYKNALLINNDGESYSLAIVKSAGYIPDHDMGDGTNLVGEYVQLGNWVYLVKQENSLTELNEEYFTYLDVVYQKQDY